MKKFKPRRTETVNNGYKPERRFEILGYQCTICGKIFQNEFEKDHHLRVEHYEIAKQVSYVPLIKYLPAKRVRA